MAKNIVKYLLGNHLIFFPMDCLFPYLNFFAKKITIYFGKSHEKLYPISQHADIDGY